VILRGSYAGRRVLVTGGLGFVGAHLLRALRGSGADVRALVSPRSYARCRAAGLLEGLGDVDFVPGDVLDDAVAARAADGREVVFNLVGSADAAGGDERPMADLDANARAHLVLLDALRRSAREPTVVLASSRLVYAPGLACPVPETAPVGPTLVYGVHKLAAERYHQLYARRHGLRAVVLRLSNTYGPFLPHQRQTGVVSALARRAARGEGLAVFGDGAQLRDFVHVSDVVRAFLAVGACPGTDTPVFNVGTGRGHSVRTLAELIARLASVPVAQAPWPQAAAATEPGDFVADVRAIRSACGWEPAVGLERGVADLLGEAVPHRFG
jgi:nucleoside-diphosphate-sugar epimerase